jgi:hypothetical protein
MYKNDRRYMNNKLFFAPYSIDELKNNGWEYSEYSNTLCNISGDHVVIIKSDLKIVNLKPHGSIETTLSVQTGPYESFDDALAAATKIIDEDIIRNYKLQTGLCIKEIFKQQGEINRIAKKAYPSFDVSTHQVSHKHECEKSPIGYCIYQTANSFIICCDFCARMESR